MATTTLRPLANTDQSVLDFTDMANREWDEWIRRQVPVKIEAAASSPCGSEHWSANPEGTGEDVMCPSYYASPCFLFDEPSFPLDSPSLPHDEPWFLPDDPPFSLDDPSFSPDDLSPLDEANLFPLLSPSPKLVPTIQPLQEVAEPHSRQPSLEKPLRASSEPSRPPKPKPKNKKRQSYSAVDNGAPKARRLRNYRLESHNEIEKRYRTGINECIDRLRQAIPRLVPTNDDSNFGEEDDGSMTEIETARPKDGKGDVLTRALEYVKHLEANATRLSNELVVLNTRLRAFEDLAMQRTVSLGDVGLPRSA